MIFQGPQSSFESFNHTGSDFSPSVPPAIHECNQDQSTKSCENTTGPRPSRKAGTLKHVPSCRIKDKSFAVYCAKAITQTRIFELVFSPPSRGKGIAHQQPGDIDQLSDFVAAKEFSASIKLHPDV